jgi:hypothetical protein
MYFLLTAETCALPAQSANWVSESFTDKTSKSEFIHYYGKIIRLFFNKAQFAMTPAISRKYYATR